MSVLGRSYLQWSTYGRINPTLLTPIGIITKIAILVGCAVPPRRAPSACRCAPWGAMPSLRPCPLLSVHTASRGWLHRAACLSTCPTHYVLQCHSLGRPWGLPLLRTELCRFAPAGRPLAVQCVRMRTLRHIQRVHGTAGGCRSTLAPSFLRCRPFCVCASMRAFTPRMPPCAPHALRYSVPLPHSPSGSGY